MDKEKVLHTCIGIASLKKGGNLEGIVLSEISHRRRTSLHDSALCELQNTQFPEAERWLPGAEVGAGDGELLLHGQSLRPRE